MPVKLGPPSKELVTNIYTADPSAHVFPSDPNTIWIYPSHDRQTDIPFDDSGNQYDMTDYHILSVSFDPDAPNAVENATATEHGVSLTAADVPWVSKQMWAPDAAYHAASGKYHLYFPARDKEGRFRLGVAVGDKPQGPFVPQPEAMKGSYSIDPASFVDEDGKGYVYFGGIWGGELQCYPNVQPAEDGSDFDKSMLGPKEPSGKGVKALGARVGRLREDFLEFDEDGVMDVKILDKETGEEIDADDHERRFFEASWCHKREDGKFVFSYSTGDTHFICYAVGDSPLGPFVYEGQLLQPVVGWTNHHSTVKYKGRWYVFYHDCERSEGVSHLRSVKFREVTW